ncbi:hypothetical protein SAMN05421759_102649 [Roseivivax lentus]|uniref:DUF4177 domain-containing protein n=1 Tax=Roseivivax lentus TaxID=633194 RepID=A0A1N7LF86_9RHOB|nr:hypothetical protein [Roseivivax lentus]SIS72431.1 hypothetical protein SAMN05421759_102649 [Roseivivax lentus]
MPHYEYRVLPAPEKGQKAKGVKGPAARFAHGIEALINEMGAEGWEYLRADTLPSVERAGLTSTTTEWRTLLVFRRVRLDHAEAFQPKELPAPDAASAPASAQASAMPDSAPGTPPEALREDAPREDALDRLLQDRAESLVAMPADLGGPDNPADSHAADGDKTSPGRPAAGD